MVKACGRRMHVSKICTRLLHYLKKKKKIHKAVFPLSLQAGKRWGRLVPLPLDIHTVLMMRTFLICCVLIR